MNKMVHPRIVETSEGIQGEFDVRIYDKMQRRFRDKGWIETKRIITNGITNGSVLEIGPGPGYLGLEWLKNTKGTTLTGVEISPEMIAVAQKNAHEYHLESRVTYIQSDARTIPFDTAMFDGVFTNGSLHEWDEPKKIFNEISRVLKPAGRYFISDLRRDISPLLRSLMYLMTKPKSIRPGLITSLNASYTVDELTLLLHDTKLPDATVSKTMMGIEIIGMKK